MANENWGAYPRLMAKRQAERAAMERTMLERFDNPAWPDLSERFSNRDYADPLPLDELAAWQNPWFWSVLLTIYTLMIALVCLLIGG